MTTSRTSDPSLARRRTEGFTLIELLIVISLIVMLMGMLTVFGIQFQQKGYVAKTSAMIERLKRKFSRRRYSGGIPQRQNTR
jgi:prepilin-type N-terminal cleavage/methylation domain-containing protein